MIISCFKKLVECTIACVYLMLLQCAALVDVGLLERVWRLASECCLLHKACHLLAVMQNRPKIYFLWTWFLEAFVRTLLSRV